MDWISTYQHLFVNLKSHSFVIFCVYKFQIVLIYLIFWAFTCFVSICRLFCMFAYLCPVMSMCSSKFDFICATFVTEAISSLALQYLVTRIHFMYGWVLYVQCILWWMIYLFFSVESIAITAFWFVSSCFVVIVNPVWIIFKVAMLCLVGYLYFNFLNGKSKRL